MTGEIIHIKKNETTREELADFYNHHGLTGTAQEFNVGTQYMGKLMDRYKIPRGKQRYCVNDPIPDDAQEEILRLYYLGQKVGTIHAKTGIGRTRIIKFLREQGVSPDVGARRKAKK